MGTGEEKCSDVQVTRSGRKGVIAGQMWEGEKVCQDENGLKREVTEGKDTEEE